MKRPLWFLCAWLVVSGCAGLTSSAAERVRSLSVLSLNIKNDAGDGRLPGVIELVRRSGADVVGLQEVGDSGPLIAKGLGFNYARLDSDTAVVSRYDLTPGPGASAVLVRIPGRGEVVFVDLHLFHAPYQPYQLLGIPYMDGAFLKTEAEAVAAARAARIGQVDAALAALSHSALDDAPIVVVGDFNEPSYLDWTAAAARSGRHPVKVAWPATKAFADAGYADAYRNLYPDPMTSPGYTWTPGLDEKNPKDHADRIDFVLFRGSRLRPSAVKIVGEDAAHADLVVTPYPTDHRGVWARFEFGGPPRVTSRGG